MRYTITIQSNISEGAIERILGKVRGRGWAINFLYAQVDMSTKSYAISLIVEGERLIENLLRQIDKLHDVKFTAASKSANVEFIKKSKEPSSEFPISIQDRQDTTYLPPGLASEVTILKNGTR